MSEENTSWFHCGRCGSLFRAPIRDTTDRRCGVCGKVPSIGTQAVVTAAAPAAPVRLPVARREEAVAGRGEDPQGERRRQGGGVAWKVAAGWLVFLVGLVVVGRMFWSAEPERVVDAKGDAFAGTAGDEAQVILDGALPQCQEVLLGFLQATSPEERNQYVFSPVRTASRMARFYNLNPVMTMDPQTLSFAGAGLLELPEERAIETRWRDGRGRVLDVVFRKESDEWRIDWSHFAREGDYPWPLYLAGDGEAEGEFRVLARERLAAERLPGEPMSLVLHAPRFGEPGKEGVGSPEIAVDAKSPAGELLEAAFRARRAERALFGSTLGILDPAGMIRVRVKLRRIEEEDGRRFEISEVVACHWLTLDVPGVDPGEDFEAKPARGGDRSRIDDE